MADNRANWKGTRRKFIAATGVAGAGMVAGCVGGDDDETIELVLNPAEEGVDINAQYLPVIEAVEDEFDVEIEGVPTQSYQATVAELEGASDGDRVMADTSPSAVTELGDEVDVMGMRVAFGGSQYFGTLTAMPGSGVEEVSDLEDEVVATNNTGSLSGGQAPIWLLQENGLDIGNVIDVGDAEDFDWRNADAHDVAIDELIEDDSVMAAGSGEFVSVPHIPEGHIDERIEEAPDAVASRLEEFKEISTEVDANLARDTDVAELRLLDVSPPLPRAPLVVNSDWDEDLRYDIQEFIIDMESEDFEHDAFDLADELGLDFPDELLEDFNDPDADADPDEFDVDAEDWSEFNDNTLWFDGVDDATHEDYEPLEEITDDLGLDLGE